LVNGDCLSIEYFIEGESYRESIFGDKSSEFLGCDKLEKFLESFL
jgi:hypothetical protein